MHNAVRSFLKEVRKEFPYKFRLKKVLEVGSQIINGSPRKYFWFCDYTGIDICKGRGVDVVLDITRSQDFYKLRISKWQYFDTIVSTEMLEHCDRWLFALENMYHLLKLGGLLIITCAGPDRAEHGTKRTTPECSPATTDYYRNITTEDFRNILPPELFREYVLMYARGENDLQFYGIKK